MTTLTRLRPRRRTASVGAACVLLTLTACSSSGGGSSTTTSTTSAAAASSVASASASSSSTSSSTAARIVIKNFLFDPATLKVAPGTVVTVVNEDQVTHTATASSGHAFDTGNIAGGKSGTFTAPTAAGSYAYTCTIHPFMKGSLTVG